MTSGLLVLHPPMPIVFTRTRHRNRPRSSTSPMVADPMAVPLPEPSARLAYWVEGSGAPVLEFQDAVLDVPEQPDAGCSVVTGHFDDIEAPDELVVIALEAPEAATAELVTSTVVAAGRVIAACDRASTRGSLVTELAYQWAILELHLDTADSPFLGRVDGCF